jgi:hypothetical protein
MPIYGLLTAASWQVDAWWDKGGRSTEDKR